MLDPEQNNTLRDHYLDVPFDLLKSSLTTANVLDPMPPALRDRMEVLELAGYTEEESSRLRRHLVGKQVNHGLTAEQLEFGDAAIRARSFGLRARPASTASTRIGALCRKVARRRAEGDETRRCRLHPRWWSRCWGADVSRRRDRERTKDPGVAVGLAWTPPAARSSLSKPHECRAVAASR